MFSQVIYQLRLPGDCKYFTFKCLNITIWKNGYDDVTDLKFVGSWKAHLRAVKVFEISQNVKFLLTLIQTMLLHGESDW